LFSVIFKNYFVIVLTNTTDMTTITASNFSGYSPSELITEMKRTADRSEAGFNNIFNAFFFKLRNYFYKEKGVDFETSRDLAIEVLSKVWERADKFDSSKSHVTTWIYSIADNHAIDYFRASQSKKMYFAMYKILFTNYDNIKPDFLVHRLSRTPEQIMINGENSKLLNGLFSDKVLGSKMMELMELRYIEQLSLNEIAEKLGMNDSTLRVNLRRAKAKMKQYIESNSELSENFSLNEMKFVA
jgi:RNA polymerase sigma-70 factor, ECF subfamily